MEIPMNEIREAVQEQRKPKRRIGRFVVGDDLLRDHREKVIDLLGGLLVLRAEHRLDMLAIEYIAEGGAFDEISVGAPAPLYDVVCDMSCDERADEPRSELHRIYFERST